MINTRTVLALLTVALVVTVPTAGVCLSRGLRCSSEHGPAATPWRYVLLRRQWQRHRNQRWLGFAVVPALLQLPALRLGYELQRRRIDTSDG